ncbi:hypothetical protein SOVF_175370, partial [Spinacia oleracea]
MRTIGPFHLPN